MGCSEHIFTATTTQLEHFPSLGCLRVGVLCDFYKWCKKYWYMSCLEIKNACKAGVVAKTVAKTVPAVGTAFKFFGF